MRRDTRFTTHSGHSILQSLQRARRFNRWTLAQFLPYVGQRVFEAGCGIGNFTEHLLERERLVCADIDPFYMELIHRRFGHLENVRIEAVDLTRIEDYEPLREERLDTIISLNVIEHLEPDAEVLSHLYDVLVPGGHAIILVPAHQWLYSRCDEELGHFRRYAEGDLREKLAGAGFEVVHIQQFNRLGVLGWYVNKLRRKGELTPGQIKLYEWLLPGAKLLDWIGLGPGLSLIAVGRKG